MSVLSQHIFQVFQDVFCPKLKDIFDIKKRKANKVNVWCLAFH